MSALRWGVLGLPVAGMGLAPRPDAIDVLGVPEVVAVGRFAKPPPLAGQLAGLAASGFAAVMLAIVITPIGEEKLAATTALTSLGLLTHRESKPSRRRKELKSKTAEGKKAQGARRKKCFGGRGGRKSQGRKYNFKPAVLMHFHSAADSWAK